MNAETKRRWIHRIGFPAGVLLALWIGIWIGGGDPGPQPTQAVGEKHDHPTTWTCSMHPQIRMPEKGKCPICHMDLIPVEEETGDDEPGPRELVMSERAKALARIRTAEARRSPVSRELRLFGKVDYDETRVATIAAWVNGRIDRMYVDYTGIPVKRGEHLVKLYSPELYATQRELIVAAQAAKRYAPGDKGPAARAARGMLRASQERLRLWGLNQAQIEQVTQRGKPSEQVTIYAPLSGVIIEKNGLEGMYVKTGTRLYTIADLSSVWIQLEAYEADLSWLRYGQPVDLRIEGLPGETLTGSISFLDPFVDKTKRTARVRVILENSDGRLRPGMYARGTVLAGIDGRGKVQAPDLTGKWISPMHPEVIRDKPGRCPVCGMKLVRAEELGLAGQKLEGRPPLVIPATAPLITGKRAIAFVEVPGKARPTYASREIVLGPRAGDHYVVLEGIEEGERVVVEGNFKLDSAMQILAKPSMMNPQGGVPVPGHDHGAHPQQEPGKDDGVVEQGEPKPIKRFEAPEAFRLALAGLVDAYLVVGSSLAADDTGAASSAAALLPAKLEPIDMGLLKGAAHHRWMAILEDLKKQIQVQAEATGISAQREALAPLSISLLNALTEFGPPADASYYRVHCPMAFDNRGAWWIQADDQVANPYFGDSMLRCADITMKIEPGVEP